MQRGVGLVEIGLRGVLFRDQILAFASAVTLRQLERRLAHCRDRLAPASPLAWKTAGSIWATTWPAFTGELKSTNSFSMLPEIWLPTCTFTTGFSVPVAVTACVIAPRVTVAGLIFVRAASAAAAECEKRENTSKAAPANKE